MLANFVGAMYHQVHENALNPERSVVPSASHTYKFTPMSARLRFLIFIPVLDEHTPIRSKRASRLSLDYSLWLILVNASSSM